MGGAHKHFGCAGLMHSRRRATRLDRGYAVLRSPLDLTGAS